jgi:hypothetical protein
MKESLAPIVVFAYNRPAHTLKTLQALRNNYLAAESCLFVYCDGAKVGCSTENMELIKQVRAIVKQENWCGRVQVIELDTNKGLAESIKSGVTEVINSYGKVIVVEDDLLTSPAFLTYMNKSLDYYANRKSVFSISGYTLPKPLMQIPEDYPYDVYVCLRNGSWGWATWADRWAQVDWAVDVYKEIKTQSEMKLAFNRGGDDIFGMLEMQQSKELNIWSIQFTVAHFMNHAVCILPTYSYVDNLGLDGSGENCNISTTLRNKALNENESIRFLDVLYEDRRIINSYYSAFCNKKRPLWQKIINRISRTLGRKNVFVVKKKIYC